MKIREGYIPYLGYQTYYRIVGESRGGKKPLLLLHGGPGSTHNYFEVLDCLAEEGREVISYDQLGCGNSWVEGEHPELWTYRTWDEELMLLRKTLKLEKLHLLGQSWGGMLAIEYLCNYRPEGVQSLILSSSLPSCALWAEEQHRQLAFLPAEEQAAVREAEQSGDYSGELYKRAEAHYMELFCAGAPTEESPECLRRPKRAGRSAYLATQGENEFQATGIFKDWEYRPRLREIEIPSLIISGTNDLCTPLIAKTMYDGLPNARWELFPGCRHMCFVEDNERYCALLNEWMEQYD